MSKTVIGHSKQRASLAALVNEERLPSSLLFSGAAGTGKKLVALELASRLLCDKLTEDSSIGGCGSCSKCKLIELGNHPDLRILEWDSGEMSVDDLRETLDKLSLRPFMGKRKVTIINDADAISIVGANILLKTLEEPRPENFFILIATTPSRLPQTVLSRCQRWFFDRLSDSELELIFKNQGASDEDLALIPLADGSCQALDLVRSRGNLNEEINATLDAAWRGDLAKMARSAQEWGGDKTTIKERLTFLRVAIRNRLIKSTTDTAASAVWAHALQNALDAEYLIIERHTNATLSILSVLKSCNQALAEQYQLAPNTNAPILDRIYSR